MNDSYASKFALKKNNCNHVAYVYSMKLILFSDIAYQKEVSFDHRLTGVASQGISLQRKNNTLLPEVIHFTMD